MNYGAIYQPQYQEYYEAICEATETSGDFKALTKICNSVSNKHGLFLHTIKIIFMIGI